MTAGILWQIEGGGDETNPSVVDGKVFDEHERRHIGFTFAWEF